MSEPSHDRGISPIARAAEMLAALECIAEEGRQSLLRLALPASVLTAPRDENYAAAKVHRDFHLPSQR